MIRIIKSALIYCLWLIISLFFTVFLLPFSLSSNRYDNRVYHKIAQFWSWLFLKVAGVRYTIKGKHNLPNYPDGPAIVLINHASALDIPLTEIAFDGYPHLWISNDYTKIPLFGTLLKRMHIVVNRSTPQTMMRVIRKACFLAGGKSRHLFMFPEGTRHADGEIHKFYSGFALLAAKLDRPVIPVVIRGLHKVFPKNAYCIDSSSSEVTLSIGKPIAYTPSKKREEFIEEVHSWFVKEMNSLKG